MLVTTLLNDLPTDIDTATAPRRAHLQRPGHRQTRLFVVYRRIAQLLTARGVTTLQPESANSSPATTWPECRCVVGWTTNSKDTGRPAHSAAYRRAAFAATVDRQSPQSVQLRDGQSASRRADNASREAADRDRCLTAIRDTIVENVQRLGDIDAVAGDGRHGIGIPAWARAAVKRLSPSRTGAGAGHY
jgi:dihydroxyacetone kinase